MVTVARRVDYEKVQTFNFVVTAADSGQPRLTSTATVYVRIQNINDENPIFGQVRHPAGTLHEAKTILTMDSGKKEEI